MAIVFPLTSWCIWLIELICILETMPTSAMSSSSPIFHNLWHSRFRMTGIVQNNDQHEDSDKYGGGMVSSNCRGRFKLNADVAASSSGGGARVSLILGFGGGWMGGF